MGLIYHGKQKHLGRLKCTSAVPMERPDQQDSGSMLEDNEAVPNGARQCGKTSREEEDRTDGEVKNMGGVLTSRDGGEANVSAMQDILSTSMDKIRSQRLRTNEGCRRVKGMTREVTFDPGRPISPWRDTNGAQDMLLEHTWANPLTVNIRDNSQKHTPFPLLALLDQVIHFDPEK